MIRIALFLSLCALSGCLGGGCNQPPPPSSDICDLSPNAPRPTVTAIEIGRTRFGAFEPILPDSEIALVSGDQGSDMIVAALRITGTGLTTCIDQSTTLSILGGDLMSSEESPLLATQLTSTTFLTGNILLPWYSFTGQQAEIHSTVSGFSTSIIFWVGHAPDIDAGIDARPTDAPPDA